MADRESVVVTGVLAALCACLVGCGDSTAPVGGSAQAQSGSASVLVVESDVIPLPSTHLPKLFIDGNMFEIREYVNSELTVSGERTIQFEFQDSVIPVVPESYPKEWNKLNGKERPMMYRPGDSKVIKPGEAIVFRWHDVDYPSIQRRYAIGSMHPGVYLPKQDDRGIYSSDTDRGDRPTGEVLYWEEHRNDDNKLVGFDLAIEIDLALANSLPPNARQGKIEWLPLLGRDAYMLNNVMPRTAANILRSTRYDHVTSEPGDGVLISNALPECAVQIAPGEDSAVVLVSMRCVPDPLPIELMEVEFNRPLPNPEGLLTFSVYLPKSPFKAEGFELSEFQEAAQSE